MAGESPLFVKYRKNYFSHPFAFVKSACDKAKDTGKSGVPLSIYAPLENPLTTEKVRFFQNRKNHGKEAEKTKELRKLFSKPTFSFCEKTI
mgnify:CR=1 FL=1